jgi:hypothetical protein
MNIVKKLAQMIGVRDDQVQDALTDESRAREAIKLSRRGFFAAGATMAAAPLVPKRAYSFLFAGGAPLVSAAPWSIDNTFIPGLEISMRTLFYLTTKDLPEGGP